MDLAESIAPEFLDHINADLNTIRDASFKAIIRFAYTNDKVSLCPLLLFSALYFTKFNALYFTKF